MIIFEHVTKKFGSTPALDDVSLEIKQGEFVFIVGPSGAGKSTFLRVLTREISPSAGKVLVGHQDITKVKDKDIPHLRRKVGVVFQDFKLLDDRTVFENDEEVAKMVEHILKLVEIWDKRDLFPRQLSGGEAQRT